MHSTQPSSFVHRIRIIPVIQFRRRTLPKNPFQDPMIVSFPRRPWYRTLSTSSRLVLVVVKTKASADVPFSEASPTQNKPSQRTPCKKGTSDTVELTVQRAVGETQRKANPRVCLAFGGSTTDPRPPQTAAGLRLRKIRSITTLGP
jgi:hypothetical protein